MLNNKPARKDDSVELTGLEVRFVSGVGQPATGEKFLLFKSADGQAECEPDEDDKKKKGKKKSEQWSPPVATSESENGPMDTQKGDPVAAPEGKPYAWAQCMEDNKGEKDPAAVCAALARRAKGDTKTAKSADLVGQDMVLPSDFDLAAQMIEARKEASNMTEQVTPQDNFLQSFVRTLATAAGLRLATDSQIEAEKHLAEIAAKATGKAPADDTHAGAPSYPANENKVPYPSNITGQAPSDDKTKGGPIKSKADKMFEGQVDQQPETVTGSIAPQTKSSADGDTVVLGTPLYKSEINEFLNRLEAQATNKEAVAAAKAALEGAFETPAQPEVQAVDLEMVKELLMEGMEPVLQAFEALDSKLEAMKTDLETVKTAKSADPAVTELTAQLADVVEAVEGIQQRLVERPLTKSVGRTPLLKSRVPAEAPQSLSTEDAKWADSAFGAAAAIR